MFTTKDPQGKLLFSGPVETKEDLDKIPAEVRQRYDKLQEEELRSVAPPADTDEDDDSADTNSADGTGIQQLVSADDLDFLRHADLMEGRSPSRPGKWA